jgi:DNA-binding CsgD family transcriptional regulator
MERLVVGRAAELAAVDTLLDTESGAAALVLNGEAGIGKTAVWEAGVAAARDRGLLVLSCRPAESESTLPFSALGDLLEPVLPQVLPRLPAPQRRALEVALQRTAAREPADRLAVHRATHAVLRELANAEPVLVAIDDLQWLDAPSAAALAFAVRRLSDGAVLVLASLREPQPDRLELAAALPPDRFVRQRLGPLDDRALHDVLFRQLGVAVPRPTMLRVHQISAGNPFYALELVRSLPAKDGRVDTTLLELPRTLLDLVADRLRALPATTKETLAAAGALGDPTISLLGQLGEGAVESLQAAEEAAVVRIDGERVRFEHPLLASGSLALLAGPQKRRLHRRLADIAPAMEERALHLALGSEGPVEESAALLEQASRRAADRGAPLTAGELGEHAARLTPADRPDDEHRRRRLAASHYLLAGEIERGREILARLERQLPAGPERAAVLLLYADTHLEMPVALSLCERARTEAVGDDACLAEAHRLSSEFAMLDGRIQEALGLARTATELARRTPDRVLLIRCLGTQSHFETYTGQITAGLLEQAVELEQATPEASAHYSPAQIFGLRLMYSDRLDEARTLLEAIMERAEERGDDLERANLLVHLAQLELRAGRWGHAHRYSETGFDLASQLGIHSDSQLFLRALVAAHLGHATQAREAAGQVVAPGEQPTYALWKIMARWAVGLLELSIGDHAAAAEHLAPLPGLLVDAGYRNPGVRPLLPDAIESLIGVGRLEEAERWTTELTRAGAALGNPWAIATGRRCAGLLAAARGDVEAAHAELGAALEAHERSPNAFERARTTLALGSLERRIKHRRAARETLSHALDLFDSLGAALWAEKAAAELARIPGRAPQGDELSETQRRIAELVVEGLSNKEIAARLFVAVRTVESNLSTVYAKLGVQSRTELASRLVARP